MKMSELSRAVTLSAIAFLSAPAGAVLEGSKSGRRCCILGSWLSLHGLVSVYSCNLTRTARGSTYPHPQISQVRREAGLEKNGMASRRKTWREKLADKEGLPKVLELERRFPCFNALHKMGVDVGENIVLVNPSEIVACMKRVPRGRLAAIVEICRHIAKKHRVKGCCTLTAGVFIMTAAHAAEEARREGADLGIPYRRIMKADGYLNDKFPGGAESHMALLENEGFKVVRAGKKWRVDSFQTYLVDEL